MRTLGRTISTLALAGTAALALSACGAFRDEDDRMMTSEAAVGAPQGGEVDTTGAQGGLEANLDPSIPDTMPISGATVQPDTTANQSGAMVAQSDTTMTTAQPVQARPAPVDEAEFQETLQK